MSKPKAVLEVEQSAPTAVDEAWRRLTEGIIAEDDIPLWIEASRRDRERWLVAQKKKGKEEEVGS